MSRWDEYKEENLTEDGEHTGFPGWIVAPDLGAWSFRRIKDNAVSHHKADTPYGFWESACEASMAGWNRLFPNPVSEDQLKEAYNKVSAGMSSR